jgi:hypothetical protein
MSNAIIVEESGAPTLTDETADSPEKSTMASPTPYDQIPYKSYPFPQSHPERLATIATLMGLNPPPIDRCRVLELGGSSGGNRAP